MIKDYIRKNVYHCCSVTFYLSHESCIDDGIAGKGRCVDQALQKEQKIKF